MAMAKENNSLPVPISRLIGVRNNPMDCRMPSPMVTRNDADNKTTSHGFFMRYPI
jgi:hypothetical protein